MKCERSLVTAMGRGGAMVAVAILAGFGMPRSSAEDLLIADFEGADFGGWVASGSAFGAGPARGALEGQMPVEGFRGAGLANSYHGGDDAQGSLISPPFSISRKYVNFLIGGGGHDGETCLNLKIDGEIVRSASGPNTAPGGSERLGWKSWDVSEWIGSEATLEIVDRRKGGWGHATVDEIVQSDVPAVREVARTFEIQKRYLLWPVAREGERRTFLMTLDGEDEPLAFARIRVSNQPDFWMFTDLANYQGRKLTVSGSIPGVIGDAWDSVHMSDDFPGAAELYQEPLRPAYHFTSRRGWINDPNGLVWHDGTWHLFYQHSPYNLDSAVKAWGHATSPDLLHWNELPTALFPDAEGSMWSGSAVVVTQNKTAIPLKGESALVLAYTAEGGDGYLPGMQAEQGLAVSEDGGKSFRKFAGNPVLAHQVDVNRDPKLFWHASSERWVMNLYHQGNEYGIYISPDLIQWERTDTYEIPNDSECPDLFELAVEGEPESKRWVVWGANGVYQLGDFDGRTFTAEGGAQRHYFGAAYAGQTFDNAPNGRRVHIGWMRDGGNEFLRGVAFSQQLTLPMDFSLRRVAGKLRMWIAPSPELANLRTRTSSWNEIAFVPEQLDPLREVAAGAFEIEAVIDSESDAAEMGFQLFGEHKVAWNRVERTFSGIPGVTEPIDGKLHVRIFVDTASVEVFVNGAYASSYLRQTPGMAPVRIVARGGSARFDSLHVHRLEPVWPGAR